MRIGIVCPYDLTKGSGVGEIVLAQAAGLRQRGHETYIITPRPTGTHGWPKHTIFIGSTADLRSPGSTTVQITSGLTKEIQDMLDTYQFDVINFHEPWLPMLGLQILTRSHAVNVGTFHARMPDGMMMRTMARMTAPYAKSVLKYVDMLTAASEPGAEYVSSLTDKPVRVIPVDIDLVKYCPPSRFKDSSKRKTILYVGRLEGRKGVRYLLRAMYLLQQKYPKVRLDIVGDGVDRGKLELLSEDLGLKHVRFWGYRPDSDKVKRFKSADLFCAPAIFGEGFGKVLLEAMACGLPTVAGDNPGYASVMKDLGMLSLVNPKDTADFARRLELFLYQNELRDLWRTWALKEVQQYSSERMVDQYEEVFREALRRKK